MMIELNMYFYGDDHRDIGEMASGIFWFGSLLNE